MHWNDQPPRLTAVPLIGGGMQPLQTVELDELVAKIYDAVDRDLRGTYTVAGDPIAYRDFYASLARSLGVTPMFVPVPFWLVEFGLRVAKTLHVTLPIDRDNVLGLRAMRVDVTRRL